MAPALIGALPPMNIPGPTWIPASWVHNLYVTLYMVLTRTSLLFLASHHRPSFIIMHSIRASVLALLALSLETISSPLPDSLLQDHTFFREEDGTKITVFEHAATGASLKYIADSKICETTPGVKQYSGYLSVGPDMNMYATTTSTCPSLIRYRWFWFFEARKDPEQAPLVTWFNGGPACSSMIGLFQENGPCRFENNASEPSLNPYSFNNVANMLYIDQPVGKFIPEIGALLMKPRSWVLLWQRPSDFHRNRRGRGLEVPPSVLYPFPTIQAAKFWYLHRKLWR